MKKYFSTMKITTIYSVLVAYLLCFCGSVNAQGGYSTDHKADQNLRSGARVNPSTLAMELSVPLIVYPGRAGNSLPVSLSYSSKVWTMRNDPVADPVTTTGIMGGIGSLQDPYRIYHITNFYLGFAERSVAGWTANGFQIFPVESDDRVFQFTVDGFRYVNFVDRVRVVLPDGSSHELRKDDKIHHCAGYQVNDDCSAPGFYGLSGTYLSVDGSGMRLKVDYANGNTLYMPDGGRYVSQGNSTVYIDRNGNKTVHTPNATDGTSLTVTDTMGRQIDDPLASYSGAAGTQTFTLPSLGDQNLTYTKKFENLKPEGCETGAETACSDAGLEDPSDELYYTGNDTCQWTELLDPLSAPRLFDGLDPTYEYRTEGGGMQTISYYVDISVQRICSANAKFNPAVMTELTLPDGRKYQFRYNRYGEMTKIIYPTGAYERFRYENFGQASFPFSQTERGVAERWVSEDGISESKHWQYHKVIGKITTISPDNTKTEVSTYAPSFSPNGFEDPRTGMPYDERVYSKPTTPGAEQTRQMIRRVLTKWTVAPPRPGGDTTLGVRDPRVLEKISIIFEPGSDVALAQMVETTYDSNSDQEYFAHLNPKQVKAYNYIALDLATAQNSDIDTIDDFFTLANVAKVTETDYLYDQNYKARNIIGLATETRVMDPANQTGVLNKSQFVYDETAYLDNNYTTAEWEDPNSNFRGEVTTARTWVNESNSWLESHTMYDNFGNVWKVWDTSGDQNRYVETQYSPTSKYAYPTKTISKGPDPTGIHGSNQGSEITRVFDFNTGLLTSVTDANGQTATTEYDGLLRPIRITPPAGGSISETIYNDTPGDTWVKSRQQIDENNWAERTTYFDRVGRAYKTRTRDIQGDVASRVEFDDFGRVARSSNPYRVDAEGNPAEPVYWSKPRYDQLNRVVETFAPATDNQTGISLGTVQFGISTLPNLIGTYVVATDASGRKSRAISGIYGLTRVDEATGKGGTVDQDLGTLANPAQATYYSYNVKGELTKITQGVQNRYFMYDSLGRLIRVRQPEQTPNPNLATSGNPENNQWTAGYSYDAFGHVVRFTDAKGINIINEYDQAGRTTSRCYTKPDIQTTATLCSQLSGAQVSLDTSQVDFYYDGKGLPQIPQFSKGSLTKVTNGVSEHRYLSFDNRGRLLTSQQITDGQTYSFAYKYNLSGGLIEETYPSGRVVKNVLDSDGGLSAVTTRTSTSPFKTIVTNFDYLPTGAVRKMMLGNGRWETAQFNERFQITQLGLGNSPTDTSLWEVDYEYGELSEDGTTIVADRNTGSIARQTTKIPTTSFSQSYRYDSLNRLTEAKETASDGTQNWKQTFGYDRFGNRTSRYQKVGDVVLPIDNYSLPVIDQATNRFTTGQGYEYDFNGNLVQDAEGRTFTFDANDKQIQVTDANQHVVGTYFYDASGARIKKITDTETTVFVYDAGGRLAAEYSTQQNLAPTTSYLTTDHLGSPRAITDKIGNVTSRRDFMPFGEEIYSGIGERSESLNYLSAGSDNVRKRFTGYEKDVETDLDYAQARMYQNSNGRFTAIDPLMASAFALNPQTFNRYTYTGNNPVNHADPSGLLYYRHRETREIRWFDDQPEGDEWEDYTDQRVTIAQGGCFATNRCVIAGDDVTFNQDGSIIYHNRDTSGGIVNIGAEVQETFLEITSQAGELLGTELLSLAPTTGSPSTIDLPTTSPGGGPLEPIGGSESIPGDGTDTGGEIDTGSSGDWKVDAAKLLYFLGQSWWASQGQSDPGDDDEIELYRGIGAPRQGDAPYWQERFRLATLGIAIPVGGHDSPKRHNDGDTDSIFTSWTTDIEVAEGEASYPHPGVVLTKKFPRSRLVASPDEYQESEVLVVGPVTGASVKFLPARR